jgi:hypothetical protein
LRKSTSPGFATIIVRGIFVAVDKISNGQLRRVEETMIDGPGKYVSREIVTSL